QPWEFIVVKNPETKSKMAGTWAECIKENDIINMTRIEELRSAPQAPLGPHALKDAPVVIVVCADRRAYQATVLAANFIYGEGGPGATFLKGMGNAVHNLQLAAAALGLGSEWVSVSRLWEQSLRTLLDVPPVLEIHTVVAVGYPAVTPPRPYRRELKEIVHFEKYDTNKYRSGEDVIQFLRRLRQR
ncbi:MAG: nitroreductase family protein, partial [Chloroflexi bacterium]|nr:nitroreductase family protein [Chloroflexota bacterium]